MERHAKALYSNSSETRYTPYSVSESQRIRCTVQNESQYDPSHPQDSEYLYPNPLPSRGNWYNSGSGNSPEVTVIEDCPPQPTSDYVELVTPPGLPFDKLCKDCRSEALMNGSVPGSIVTTPENGASSFLSETPWPGEMSFSSSEFTQPAIHIIEPPQPSQNARVTTPEKPFECHYCNKDFPKKADRDRHEASVHRGEMSMPPGLHDCPERGCTRDKGFTRKDNLLDHLRRVHNKDIPKRKPRI